MSKTDMRQMLWFILDTEQQFTNRIDQVIAKWGQHRGKDDPISELPYNQAQATYNIFRLGPCSLSDVAKTLKISKSSASQMVQRLVEKEMIIRKQDPDNRRKVLIEIEPTVKSLFEEMDEHLQTWMAKIAEQLGQDTVQDWYKIMTKLQLLLKQDAESNQ